MIACSTSPKNTTLSISPSIEKKLVTLWENKSNQEGIEKELAIKFLKIKDQKFEYINGMHKVFAEFGKDNKELIRLVFVSYELNPKELQKLTYCLWIENSKSEFLGKQKVERKEYFCNDKKILIKNNQQSHSLWEAWFGF